MAVAVKMSDSLKTIMPAKCGTRLKSVLVCQKVLVITFLLCSHVTQTSPYLARRNVNRLVEFPPTNHVGKQLTRAISRGDPLVASFSNPLPSVALPSANSNLGIISTGPVASITAVEPSLQRLMTPPPPTTGTSTSTSKSLSYSSKFYSNSDSSKDRYANSYHTGGSGNFDKPPSKSHFNKKSYVGSPYNEKHESTKRYAMTYHTGPSGSTYPETSTSATFIINDYTNKSSIARLSKNDNFQNTVPHSGLTGSSDTFNPVTTLPNTHDHLHNIKQQLLHTAFSNNYPQQNTHLNTNQLGSGNYHSEYTTLGPSAPQNTGFQARQNQEFPTVAAATVGASIQFSQNSAQYPGQQQQHQFGSSWNQNNNFQNQNPQQQQQQQPPHHLQQQPTNQFPTGFDPRAQTRLPWAHNRFPTEHRAPPSASGTAPAGRYNIPFLHHQLAHPYNHGAASQPRPSGTGYLPPATKSPITPTFGLGTTGNYAAVRDPSQMPAEGRREKVTLPPPPPPPPPQPVQVQTPPPPIRVQSSTTLGSTTKNIEKIQETTEPITSASEAESKFIESSTKRGGGDGYGWGPEGASSGGNEEGGIANVFVDIVTSKIKSIQATVNGIQAAIKGAKRSSARKIANKIEGIGTFVNAVTKGVSGVFEAKANKYSDNKGWGRSSSNSNKNMGWGGNSNGGSNNNGGGRGWGSGGNGGGNNNNGGSSWGSGGGGNGGGYGSSGMASGGNFAGGYGSGGGGSFSNNNGGGNFGNSGAASGGNFGNGGGFNAGGNFGNTGASFGAGSSFNNGGGNGGNFGGGGGFSIGGGNSFGSSASASSGGGGYDNFNNGGNGFGGGGGGSSNNIPQSAVPNNGNGGTGNGNLQGGVIGNVNPFEGTSGSGNQGGYDWNQG